MTALEQVAQMKSQAITILLAEREQIDHELQQLGHGHEKAPSKRGRKPKQIQSGGLEQHASHSETTGPTAP